MVRKWNVLLWSYCAFMFNPRNPREILQTIVSMVEESGCWPFGLMRIWLAQNPYIFTFHPEIVEPVLNSSKHMWDMMRVIRHDQTRHDQIRRDGGDCEGVLRLNSSKHMWDIMVVIKHDQTSETCELGWVDWNKKGWGWLGRGASAQKLQTHVSWVELQTYRVTWKGRRGVGVGSL